jgi:NAD(P)-dependent dehydrogenase (short-subunit alcohol dehydrogenase family)
MEGMGSDGRKHTGLAAYGTTKAAVRYFTESLAEEMKNTSLVVGALSPGMVITDMIVDQYKDRPDEWARVKKIFNIIADRVENVTPWLAERVLGNQKTGVRIRYSSRLKIMGRMLLSPFRTRNIVD